jgi:integrase
MQSNHRKGHVGIVVKHRKGCRSEHDGRCNCDPRYQASVWSARDKRRLRREFPTLGAAKAWRQDALVALRKGTMRATTPKTLREVADAWLEGARSGAIRNRSGDRYKSSAIRGYEQALRARVLPDLGGTKLAQLTRADVQALADRLQAEGLDPSTIRNQVMPLRAIYRRAVSRGEVAVNPTTGLELPAVRGKRDRIASPTEAEALIAALPAGDRPLWATAMYAGLRLGELRALDWSNVDLAGGVIRVERSWDAREGAVAPKSTAGTRKVPVPAVLRDYLVEHRMRQGERGGLVFGRSVERPFAPSTIGDRATRAWQDAGVEPIGLHECRHTFASLMIDAGVNPKALSTYMGHANISITLDRYGHLMPGNEEEAAGMLDSYLQRAGNPNAVTSHSASGVSNRVVVGDTERRGG